MAVIAQQYVSTESASFLHHGKEVHYVIIDAKPLSFAWLADDGYSVRSIRTEITSVKQIVSPLVIAKDYGMVLLPVLDTTKGALHQVFC